MKTWDFYSRPILKFNILTSRDFWVQGKKYSRKTLRLALESAWMSAWAHMRELRCRSTPERSGKQSYLIRQLPPESYWQASLASLSAGGVKFQSVCVCGRKGERGRDAGVNVRVRKWDRRRFSETDCRKEETKHIDKKVCVHVCLCVCLKERRESPTQSFAKLMKMEKKGESKLWQMPEEEKDCVREKCLKDANTLLYKSHCWVTYLKNVMNYSLLLCGFRQLSQLSVWEEFTTSS